MNKDSEETKNMFTMERDFMVKGYGFEVWFDAHEATHVPPALHTEAMRCGAVAMDAKNVAHIERKTPRLPEVQGEKRAQTITRAMDQLVADNTRLAFGADGLPTTKAIFRLTGIDLERNERDAIWQVRAKKLAAAADPNSNTTVTDPDEPETQAPTAPKKKGARRSK